MTSPSTLPSSSGRRTLSASAPESFSAATCSLTSPCNASTPTRGLTPYSLGPPTPARGYAQCG
ncbi:Uncharacterised protein [Mycobacteroides abscessus subsp. abscessus]|nr:Uncharacterised protein [Mycobacteroides abscessus subsp. abscessus]